MGTKRLIFGPILWTKNVTLGQNESISFLLRPIILLCVDCALSVQIFGHYRPPRMNHIHDLNFLRATLHILKEKKKNSTFFIIIKLVSFYGFHLNLSLISHQSWSEFFFLLSLLYIDFFPFLIPRSS